MAEPKAKTAIFLGKFGIFRLVFRVPAPFNLHLRNARTEVRCTVSRSLFAPSLEDSAQWRRPPPNRRQRPKIFASIAETTGLSKRDIGNVFDALNDQIKKAVGRGGSKTFTIPGLCKIVVQHKPATKERKGINPFTKEETVFKAKPARNVVKIRPLKKLKDMVS